MELLSERSLLDFGKALSTAVLLVVTIKSAFLSMSIVDLSPEKSAEPRAASSVDSNTSLSVWSNEFLSGGASMDDTAKGGLTQF